MSTEKAWSSDAGPRQTKQAMDAIGELKYHGRQINVIGDHGTTCVVPYPGQVSPACLQAIETIGNSVGWKITKENYKNIMAACAHAIKIVPIPERDERSTPEEREAREKANAARQAAYEEKAKADKAAIASLVAELKKNKWWETTMPGCGYNLSQLVQAALRHTSFPPGAVVTGVTDREGGTALEQYLATFDAPTAPAVPEPVDMSILGQYKRLQDAHPDDLILLKMPEGYSAYGENAKILNEVLGSVLTQSAPMACIGLDELDTSKAAIEAAGYTVTVGEYQTAAPTQGGLPCHVEKHHHTKRGFDFWLVVTDERVDEDTYKSIRSKCEALGGWYSRKWGKCPGGYAFKDETVANQFAASL